MEVIDFPGSALSPEQTAFVAIQVLQQQGQSAAARSLVAALTDNLIATAEQLLSPGSEVKLIYNQSSFAWVGNLERFLRFYDQTASADRLSVLQIAYLRQLAGAGLLSQQLVFANSPLDLAAAIVRFSAQAKAAGIADQADIAQQIVTAAITAGRPELAAGWEAQAGLSPKAQAELWLQRANNIAYGSDPAALLSALDKALSLFQQEPIATRTLDNLRANQWIDLYLRFGKAAEARQVVKLMGDGQGAQQWAIRLDCL
ncbi:MAG: hypothetical protein HC824_13240 [Synechococcales cyanobacterium RM1_1_8]|nr:hypothetical protein [Synechococcales cyanobacterium RM1_1_8]